MTDLTDEDARSRLAALLLTEPRVEDVEGPTQEFEKLLERLRHQRRAREVWKGIAGIQQQSGAKTAQPEELRNLLKESAVVYQSVGGVAQPIDDGPAGP